MRKTTDTNTLGKATILRAAIWSDAEIHKGAQGPAAVCANIQAKEESKGLLALTAIPDASASVLGGPQGIDLPTGEPAPESLYQIIAD